MAAVLLYSGFHFLWFIPTFVTLFHPPPPPFLPPLSLFPSLPPLFFNCVLMSLRTFFFSCGRKRDYAKLQLGQTSLILPVAASCTREKQAEKEQLYRQGGGRRNAKMSMATKREYVQVLQYVILLSSVILAVLTCWKIFGSWSGVSSDILTCTDRTCVRDNKK